MGFDAHNNLNFPNKIFGDTSNTMNPPSVPRKLRSAIKKRSCEPLRNGCMKKLKLSTQNGPTLLPLSKEEEEVAETLSALAGLIPPSGSHVDDDVDCGSKGSVLPNEGTNVGSKELVQENSPTETENLNQPKLSERRQLNLDLQVSVPSENSVIPSLLRNCDMKEQQALLSCTEPHIRFKDIDGVTSHEKQHGISLEKTGLTPRARHGFGVGLSLQPFAVMFPSWLNTTATTASSGLGAREDNVSIDKVSCAANGVGKSWKKCATHVYISRLIQSLRTSEGKDGPPSDANLRQSQCVAGAQLDHPETVSNAAKVDPNGTLTSCRPDETAHFTPVNHRHLHDQDRPSISGCSGSQKQGFDFLSLSAGVGPSSDDVEAKSVERGVKNHADFLRSVGQNGALMSFALQQNHVPSSSYQDHLGVLSGSQVHLPIPPYFSNNPFGTTHMRQQQQIWPAALTTAPFRPGSSVISHSHITNWQNMRPNLQLDTRHMPIPPSLIPSSTTPSLGGHGAKYLHVSQQPVLSLRAKSQPNQVPLRL